MEDCLGTQPYLIEHYDSDTSTDMDSTSESEDGQQFDPLMKKGDPLIRKSDPLMKTLKGYCQPHFNIC